MKKTWALALVPLMAIIAACGSSGGGSSSGSSSAPAPTTSSAPAPTSSSGGAVPLPKGTIGVLQIQGAAEAVTRISNDIKTGAEAMGWEAIITDGKGTPATMAQGITDFIARGVNGIITIAVDAPMIAPQLEQAKAAGIPVIAAPFPSSDPNKLFAGQVGPTNEGYAKSMVDYLVDAFPAGTEYVTTDVTAVSSAHDYVVAVTEGLDKAGFVNKGVGDGNPADIVNSMSAALTTVLAGAPNAKFVLSCCDFTPGFQWPILVKEGRTDMLLTARFDEMSSLTLLNEGANLALGAANYTTAAMVALNDIFAFTAKGTAIPSGNDQSLYEFAVVDKANVPAKGSYFFDDQTQINEWVAKWKAEYTV